MWNLNVSQPIKWWLLIWTQLISYINEGDKLVIQEGYQD